MSCACVSSTASHVGSVPKLYVPSNEATPICEYNNYIYAHGTVFASASCGAYREDRQAGTGMGRAVASC